MPSRSDGPLFMPCVSCVRQCIGSSEQISFLRLKIAQASAAVEHESQCVVVVNCQGSSATFCLRSISQRVPRGAGIRGGEMRASKVPRIP